MTARKLLAALVITIIISFGFGRTVYASELSSVTDLAVDNGTESTEASSVTEDTDTTADSADTVIESNDEQAPEETPSEEIPQSQDTEAEEGSSDKSQQADNNITSDETEEAEEPTAQDIPEVKPAYTQQDLRLLSCLIYAEAGNQSYQGMLAVANVVLNRVKSNVFWHVDTIKEVIYDHKWSVQFAVTIKDKKSGVSMLDKALKCYDTGKFSGANPYTEKTAMDKAIKAAKAALNGKNNIGNYLCFTNKSIANSIKKKYSNYKIIGDQIFFRTK